MQRNDSFLKFDLKEYVLWQSALKNQRISNNNRQNNNNFYNKITAHFGWVRGKKI